MYTFSYSLKEMVYRYKRKTKRCENYNEDVLHAALKDITHNNLSIRSTFKKYNIPYPTLRRHHKKKSSKIVLGRYKHVFSEKDELKLVKYLTEMDDRFFGLTRSELRTLALQFAKHHGIRHPFSSLGAGKGWLKGFLERQRIETSNT